METLTLAKKSYSIDSLHWAYRGREDRLYPDFVYGEGNWMFTPIKTIEHPFLQALIGTGAILAYWMGELTLFAKESYVMFHVCDGFINIECISTLVEARGKGSATQVMQAIIECAKETNTEIRLRASNVTVGNIFIRCQHIVMSEGAKKKGKIPVAKLPKWYAKLGFIKVADCIYRGKKNGVNMVYNAK